MQPALLCLSERLPKDPNPVRDRSTDTTIAAAETVAAAETASALSLGLKTLHSAFCVAARPQGKVVVMSASVAMDVVPKFSDWCLHNGEEPMPETSLHYYFSALIVSAIRWVFRDRSDVFVAANFAWFSSPNDSRDPDVLVAFGRPNTSRSSWRNDREEGVSPAVVFEMKSRSNTRAQVAAKRNWYEKNGVVEYYEYDPDLGTFRAWIRSESGRLEAVLRSVGMTSPLLNLTFVLNGSSLELVGPNGRILGDYVAAESVAEAERERAELERDRAELEATRAESESARADVERDRANAAVAELDALKKAIAEGR